MIKKSYFYLFFILITFNSIQFTYAQKSITGSKELPLEINLLLSSIQLKDPSNYEIILPLVMNIDQYARSLSKEDIFLIGKVEIYKTLLKNYATPNKTPVDGTTVIKLRNAINKSKDNFVKWFLEALLKDSIDLIQNSFYKEFLLQRNSNIKDGKLQYRRLEKKAELIQFWVAKIKPDQHDDLINDLAPKMIEALKNIQNSFYLMAYESSMTPLAQSLKTEKELKFFSVKIADPVKKEAPVASGQKSVEDILAPISEDTQIDLPKPSEENWLEEENNPPSLQNLPKPKNDADWLQDF